MFLLKEISVLYQVRHPNKCGRIKYRNSKNGGNQLTTMGLFHIRQHDTRAGPQAATQPLAGLFWQRGGGRKSKDSVCAGICSKNEDLALWLLNYLSHVLVAREQLMEHIVSASDKHKAAPTVPAGKSQQKITNTNTKHKECGAERRLSIQYSSNNQLAC